MDSSHKGLFEDNEIQTKGHIISWVMHLLPVDSLTKGQQCGLYIFTSIDNIVWVNEFSGTQTTTKCREIVQANNEKII